MVTQTPEVKQAMSIEQLRQKMIDAYMAGKDGEATKHRLEMESLKKTEYIKKADSERTLRDEWGKKLVELLEDQANIPDGYRTVITVKTDADGKLNYSFALSNSELQNNIMGLVSSLMETRPETLHSFQYDTDADAPVINPDGRPQATDGPKFLKGYVRTGTTEVVSLSKAFKAVATAEQLAVDNANQLAITQAAEKKQATLAQKRNKFMQDTILAVGYARRQS